VESRKSLQEGAGEVIAYSKTLRQGTVVCDICGYDEKVDGDTDEEFVEEALKSGFVFRGEGKTQEHFCEECGDN
jgi:hypothetical protein